MPYVSHIVVRRYIDHSRNQIYYSETSWYVYQQTLGADAIRSCFGVGRVGNLLGCPVFEIIAGARQVFRACQSVLGTYFVFILHYDMKSSLLSVLGYAFHRGIVSCRVYGHLWNSRLSVSQ